MSSWWGLHFPREQFIFCFSENIAKHYLAFKHTQVSFKIFIPPVDPNEFQVNFDKEPFQLISAGKYRHFVGTPSSVVNLPSIEIMREGKDMQSREELKLLLRKVFVLYSSENSFIITEAILSGTPVRLIRNEFFPWVIGEKELGWGGLQFCETIYGLEIARASIYDGIQACLSVVENFPKVLESFVQATQDYFGPAPLRVPLNFKQDRFRHLNHRLTLGIQVLKTKGFLVFTRVVFHYFLKRIGLISILRRS